MIRGETWGGWGPPAAPASKAGEKVTVAEEEDGEGRGGVSGGFAEGRVPREGKQPRRSRRDEGEGGFRRT